MRKFMSALVLLFVSLAAPASGQSLSGLVLDQPTEERAAPVVRQEVVLMCGGYLVGTAIGRTQHKVGQLGMDANRMIAQVRQYQAHIDASNFASLYAPLVGTHNVLGRVVEAHWQQFRSAAVATATTNASGRYSFGAIEPGDYIVASRIPSDAGGDAFAWEFVKIAAGKRYALDLKSLEASRPADQMRIGELGSLIEELEAFVLENGLSQAQITEARALIKARSDAAELPAAFRGTFGC
jgi:hypothetical protein